MNWVLVAVLCVILVEFVVRLPLQRIVSEFNVVVRKALHTLGAQSVSDHWKEKVMLAYARVLFTSTIKLAGILLAVGTVAYLLILVFDYFGATTGNFIISQAGILFSIVVATGYFALRKFLV